MSKFCILGLGSIGQRHAANLRILQPEGRIVAAAHIVTADPAGHADYIDWKQALDKNPDASAALICSPTDQHIEQMVACIERHLNFFVEKPPCLPTELPKLKAIIEYSESLDLRCAVGFNYRYHSVITRYRSELSGGRHLAFYARDDLEGHYGKHVDEVMAAHPLDTACWLLGNPLVVTLETDGLEFSGKIVHEHGVSTYDIHMTKGPRQSIIHDGYKTLDLPRNDDMYKLLLRDWLIYVETGARTPRLPTLTDGARVVEILGKCKQF